MVYKLIPDSSAAIHDDGEFLPNLLLRVNHLEHPAGFLRVLKHISPIGGQHLISLGPKDGNILNDDLPADAQFLRQRRSGQGFRTVF